MDHYTKYVLCQAWTLNNNDPWVAQCHAKFRFQTASGLRLRSEIKGVVVHGVETEGFQLSEREHASDSSTSRWTMRI